MSTHVLSGKTAGFLVALFVLLGVTADLAANTPYWSSALDSGTVNCSTPAVVPARSGVNGTLIYAHSGCPGANGYSAEGVSSNTTYGGSWISTTTSPTGAQHEVRAKLKFASTGGAYVVYLSSSTSTWYKPGGSSTGGGFAVVIRPTSQPNPGVISAYYEIREVQPGYSQQLAGGTVTLTGTSTIRAVRTDLSGTWKILLYVDDTYITAVTDSSFTSTSRPGFGGYGSSVSNLIDEISYYAVEHGVPDNAALNSGLTHVVAPTYASFQWNPINDTDGGSAYGAAGMAHYEIYRNGSYRGRVKHIGSTMTYLDSGLTPATNYTYVVRAVDFHGNYTEVSRAVTTSSGTPGSISTLPRRIGLHSSVATWGAGGESLDLLSGNLHYAYPILSAQGRNGYAAPLVLSYL